MLVQKEEKKKEEKRKKKQIEIHKLRANQKEFKNIGDKWVLEWKGQTIGDGPRYANKYRKNEKGYLYMDTCRCPDQEKNSNPKNCNNKRVC